MKPLQNTKVESILEIPSYEIGVNKLHRITRQLSCEIIIRVKRHSSAVHMDAYVSACLDPDYECFFAAVPPVHSLAQIASFIFPLL